jgi:penicillin-binding protein 1A
VWSYVLFPNVPIPARQESSLAQTTRIYAADGSLLATLHGEINREPVLFKDLPPYVSHAAVAAEDARFYQHGGVDTRSIVRAFVADIAASSWIQGGSTITQQFVKDAYVGNRRSLGRKVEEARLAQELERRLTKDQILELYLNTVYFGEGAYGIQAAANTFFDKPASQLTLSEAAQLVAVIPSPFGYSPYEHPQAAEERRVWVLDRMVSLHLATPAEVQAARDAKPQLAPLRPPLASDENPASAWFVDAVKNYLFARYGSERVLTGGMEVHTTLDPKLQASAEKVLAQNLPDPADPYAALASVDPRTGYVRALVGGRDYSKEKFNIAVQGRRQPGSAFKPFVLVAALEQGISPSAVFSGPSSICLGGWTPDCHVSNFGGEGWGSLTLTEATVHSVNTVYAQLVLKVGPGKVVDVARRMGIPAPSWMVPAQVGCRPFGSPICRTDIRSVPSLALGSQEVTPLEMASAYATLAAGGVYREPKVVSKIVDRSGKVLESGPSAPRQAIDRGVADEATRILTQVIKRGTGTRADIGRPAAGKTGTAEDIRNAWFVGYTDDMSTAVWVGFRDTNLPLVDIHGFRQVTGGTIPAMLWAQYMSGSDLSVTQSPLPGPILVQHDFTYRLSVENGGPWQASSVALADALPPATDLVSSEASQGQCRQKGASVECALGDLDSGAKATVALTLRPRVPGTFTYSASVMSAAPKGGGSDPTPENNVVQTQLVVVPAADLSVTTATASSPQLLGSDVTSVSKVTNKGPSPATQVTLTQTLPSPTSLVSSAVIPGIRNPAPDMASAFCTTDGSKLQCSLGTLPQGATATVTVIVRPETTGTWHSTVSTGAAEADDTPANNGVESSVDIIPSADLTLTGSGPADAVPIGTALAYTYEVANAGPSKATGVTVTDILPAGSSLVSAKPSMGSCTQGFATVVCNVGVLSPMQKATVTVVVTPTATGRTTSQATVSAKETDPAPGGETATPAATVVPSADLSVRGTVSPGTVLAGDQISYEVYVTNGGLSPATDVTLSATLPDGTSFVSASAVSAGTAFAACRPQGRVVACRLGGLGVREEARIMMTLRADAPGPAVARFEAHAAEVDQAEGNNQLDLQASVASGSAGSPMPAS